MTIIQEIEKENNTIVSDFDKWYDSYAESGHPPKSSVLSYLIRLKNKEVRKAIRKVVASCPEATTEEYPDIVLMKIDNWKFSILKELE